MNEDYLKEQMNRTFYKKACILFTNNKIKAFYHTAPEREHKWHTIILVSGM